MTTRIGRTRSKDVRSRPPIEALGDDALATVAGGALRRKLLPDVCLPPPPAPPPVPIPYPIFG